VLGREAGWPLWSLFCLAAFRARRRRVLRASARDHRAQRRAAAGAGAVRERAFSVGIAIILVYYTTLVSFFLTTTLFLQIGWRATRCTPALVLLLPARSSSSASIATPRLMRRYAPPAQGGVALAALGFAGTTAPADAVSAISRAFLQGTGSGEAECRERHPTLSRRWP